MQQAVEAANRNRNSNSNGSSEEGVWPSISSARLHELLELELDVHCQLLS